MAAAAFGKRILFLYWVVGSASQMMMRWEILYLYLLWCHALLLIMPLLHVACSRVLRCSRISFLHLSQDWSPNKQPAYWKYTHRSYIFLFLERYACMPSCRSPASGSQHTMHNVSALHQEGMIWRKSLTVKLACECFLLNMDEYQRGSVLFCYRNEQVMHFGELGC